MNFSKKPEQPKYPPKQNDFKPTNVAIDWSTHEVDTDCELPAGKYRGKTLQWVIDHDAGYSRWIYEKGLISSWGLVRNKQSVIREEVKEDYFLYQGRRCIGVMFIPGTGKELEIL